LLYLHHYRTHKRNEATRTLCHYPEKVVSLFAGSFMMAQNELLWRKTAIMSLQEATWLGSRFLKNWTAEQSHIAFCFSQLDKICFAKKADITVATEFCSFNSIKLFYMLFRSLL